MSRSYKRTPYVGLAKDKFFKNYANRKLRRLPPDELPLQHSSYKKNFSSYDICDYKEIGISFQHYWESLVESWHNWRKNYGYPYPDYDKAYKEYYRWYKRK